MQSAVATASRLYVRLSLRDIEVSWSFTYGWNTSNIISRLVSLGCSLFTDRNIVDLKAVAHGEIKLK